MTNVILKPKKADSETIKEIIDKNFTKVSLMDIYLVNGIKMSAYIVEVLPGKYILLDRLNEHSTAHMVFWDTIVTITKNVDHSKKTEVNGSTVGSMQIILNKEINKTNIFVNKNLFIYLSNGIKLDGLCLDMEEGSYIVLEKNNSQQIILWHAIATMSIVASTEPVGITDGSKHNHVLKNLLNKKVAIFLKGGIKLHGLLTDFTDSDDSEWQFVLDAKQLVRAQHISTITEFKEA